MYELLIQNGGTVYAPAVEKDVTWKTVRSGTPGELSFSVFKDEPLNFQEGNPVSFRVDGKEVFYGFVFQKQRSRDGVIKVTARDQLRYLKNKDTILREGITASQLLRLIAQDFRLNLGTIEETGYVMPVFDGENETLFDMLQSALDETVQNTGRLFCLYDDFGKLTLRDVAGMKTDLLLEAGGAEDFDYTSSIDSDTYNKIKLVYDNEESGAREVYIAQNSEHQNQWGVLQYYESVKTGIGAKEKADALLQLYDQKTRTLTVKGVFGDLSCRAGASIGVHLDLGDLITQNYMVIEQATHTFSGPRHTMDLKLIGGEFIA